MIKTYIKYTIKIKGLHIDLSVASWQYRQTDRQKNAEPTGYADNKQ